MLIFFPAFFFYIPVNQCDYAMNVDDCVRKGIDEIREYVPGETIPGTIKLASNENNYGPSPAVVERLKKAAGGISSYPFRDRQVEEAIAEYSGVSPDMVLCGNGSDELLELILKVFKGPAQGFRPSFSQYGIYSSVYGVEYAELPLGPEFDFPCEDYVKNLYQANLAFLCSPNNPTGKVISRRDVEAVLSKGKPTVVDEAYMEFGRETSAGLLENFDNLIVLRTFSKAFGLAGLRAGYALASPRIITLLRKVKSPFNVNLLAQEAVLAALDDVEYMQRTVSKIGVDRERLFEKLSESYRVIPGRANFLLVDVSPMKAQEFYVKMLEKKIVVRKFGSFPGFEGEYVRISVGTSRENEMLMKALDEI